MRTSDFDYDLPSACIAQTPLEPRDASRLLVLHRSSGALEHAIFRDIGAYLKPGDLLVLNQTRVIPARIFARKPTGGRVEILLLRQEDLLTWECLVGGKGLSAGKTLIVESADGSRRRLQEPPASGDAGVRVEILAVLDGSRRRVRFSEPIEPCFPEVGHIPLPPYIHEKLADPERYQTVYARQPGSAAAPTAGLHFTPRLLDELRAQGVGLAYVTLHVGLDTFAPVTEEDPSAHHIHTEWCDLPPETAEAIDRTRRAGGRIIAVGTTSVRTLETAARTVDRGPSTVKGEQSPSAVHHPRPAPSLVEGPAVCPFAAPTGLYILPGYEFGLVDGMITNFHLPRSTLIMLVSAFAGRERILRAYETAIQEGYRFYSFGDAMLIL